jgi:uncharacterized protein with von Willebrand factor type A (vWA) domain
MSSARAEALLRKLVAFSRLLREGRVECGPGRLQDAVRALEVVDITSRTDVYWALRCTLISRHDDVDVFDAAFAAFWDGAPVAASERGREIRQPSAGGQRIGAGQDLAADRADGGADSAAERAERGTAWSAVERLRRLDFTEYGPEELRRARRLVERVARAAPHRRSRRLEAAHDGRKLDARRTLQSAMRTGGHPLERSWRRRRLVPRKLLFLVDVSGSMEPYARATIMFLQAAVGPGRKVEAFTFGTRLTRVTGQLEGRDPDRALRAASETVPDWAGGTRIGENLRAFNDRGACRGLVRGAVVVIVSDGWERGDPQLLAAEMRRLHRAAHVVVWVNPLAAEPGFEPLAQGMAAALPHVDVFAPAHDLASLAALATHLSL